VAGIDEKGAAMKVLIAGTLAAVTASALAQEPQAPTFRSVTHTVAVDVSVFDDERAVLSLGAKDFNVTDNGVRQTISGVLPNNLPLDLRLLFDTSGSISQEDLERYRRAMVRVAGALRPEDRIEILTFSGRISEVVGLQHPPVSIATARQPRDGTSFFDAVSLAMITRPSFERRQVTIILTDAQDNTSFFDKDTLYESARRTHAVIYGVLPTGLAADASRYAARLEAVARVTGGRLVRARRDAEMGNTIIRTLNEFRQGYVLHYALAGVPLAGWHKLAVQVTRPGRYTVRAREGYFAR
jgi:VWFA-related protein